jgi:hypothetical protein
MVISLEVQSDMAGRCPSIENNRAMTVVPKEITMIEEK